MLHRFGKHRATAAAAHHTSSAATPLLRRSANGASKPLAGPLRTASSSSTATASASSAASTAYRPQIGTTLNGLFRAPHQHALRRLFASAASRAAAGSSASGAASAATATARTGFSKVGGALAAASLVAAGIAVTQTGPAARADAATSSAASSADATPAVPLTFDAALPLPSPSGTVSLKKKKSGAKKPTAEDDEVRIDPHAPTYMELNHGARTVTEFNTWNGIDLKFAYSPLPPQSDAKAKDFSLVHHIALGSPQSKEEEPTAVYDLTGIVALGMEGGGEPAVQLQAKVADTGVEGMVRTTLFRRHHYLSPLSTQVSFHTTGEDSQPVGGALETNYHGRGYTVDASYRLRPSVTQLAYIQNIPVKDWKCALGAEFAHAFDSQNSALSYAGRAAKGMDTYSVTLQPWTYAIASFQRRFESSVAGPQSPASGVTLATDLHYSMADHMAMVSAGVAYQLQNFFNVKAMCNSNQQIASSLEAMLGPAVAIGVCGDIKHAENKYAFGLSLSFGGG